MAIDISLDEFIAKLGHGVVGVAAHNERMIRAGAHIIETAAKEMIGEERPEWPPLADSTNAERQHLGFPPDEPLLRTGRLRAAIESEVRLTHDGAEAVIGVKDAIVGTGTKQDPVRNIGDIAVDQELGTRRIPARSFLALAALDETPALQELFGADFVAGLFGGGLHAPFVVTRGRKP